VSLVVLAVGQRVAPRLPVILFVALAGMAVSWWLDLEGHDVAVVGSIPAGLPSLTVPTVPLGDVLVLVPSAAGIALVAFADAILTARSFAGRHQQTVDANQELVALGGLNIAAGLVQSFPVGSSGSRTAVNDRAGGRTQVAALAQAMVVVVVLLLLTAPIGYLPESVLAAIIVFAASGLIDVTAWRSLGQGSRVELGIAVVTAVGMLTIGLLPALALAVMLSVFDVARRSAQPHDAVLGWSASAGRFVNVSIHPTARLVPGVVVYRLDDRLFFANSEYFRERVRAAIAAAPYDVERFVFDAEAVTHIDGAGADALRQLVADLDADGVSFSVARLKTSALEKFDQFGLVATIGEDHFFPTVRAAVFGDDVPL
jgi:sulfate permease, SulP family